MTNVECIAAAKAGLPIVHSGATHSNICYERIDALMLKADGNGELVMSVVLKSKTGNSVTYAKPEHIRIKKGQC